MKRDDEIDQLNRNLNEMLKRIFPGADVRASVFPVSGGIGIKIDMGSKPAHVDFDKLQEVLRQYMSAERLESMSHEKPASNSEAEKLKPYDLEIMDAGDRYYITREVDVEKEDVERIDIGRNAVTIYKKNGSYAGFGLPELEPINPRSLKYTLKEGVLDIEVEKEKAR